MELVDPFSSPERGDLRVTVPLPNVYASGVERQSRIVVAPHIVLVPIDERETRRLAESYYRIDTGVRLELSGLASVSREDRLRFSMKLRTALEILTLVSSQVYSQAFAVVDEYSGDAWVRAERLNWAARDVPETGVSYISQGVARTWQDILLNWPAQPDPALLSALNYHSEAVQDALEGKFGRAVVASAIAAEIILGDSQTNEVTYRMSLRAGHLLGSSPEEGDLIRQRCVKLYGLRSRVVHMGKPVTFDDANSWVNVSAQLVLAAAAFGGSLVEMRKELEKENFSPSDAIRRLHDSRGNWWKGAMENPECDVAPPANWMLPPDDSFL